MVGKKFERGTSFSEKYLYLIFLGKFWDEPS